jgi:hypothetical protein
LFLKAGLQGHLPSSELIFSAAWIAPDLVGNPLDRLELIDAAAAYRRYAPQLLAQAARTRQA